MIQEPDYEESCLGRPAGRGRLAVLARITEEEGDRNRSGNTGIRVSRRQDAPGRDELPKLFTRFFRTREVRAKGGGRARIGPLQGSVTGWWRR